MDRDTRSLVLELEKRLANAERRTGKRREVRST